MKFASTLLCVAAALTANTSSRLAAQQIDCIKDAPFTATWSMTRHKDGKTLTEKAQLARASSGSTYAAETIDGRLFQITIQDLPNNRTITLHPSPESFSYTYILTPAPGGRFRRFSIERTHQMLQDLQNSYIQNPEREKPNGKSHEVPLGVSQEDGMTLFGHREEFTSDTGEKRISEVWFSDLGIGVSTKTTWPANGDTVVFAISDIRRVEPDPKLFEIPAEYLPHQDALLDARTIFIDNRTGIEEVENSAKDAFNDWKRMAVVSSKGDADLVAVFTAVTVQELAIPTIEMKVYAPASNVPVFVSHIIYHPAYISASAGDPIRAKKGVAANCVASLRNRVENTHIGELQIKDRPPAN